MKTRYFVSDDCTAVDKDDLRAELILVGAVFKFKERKEDCGEEVSDFFCYVGGVNEKYITKVEEMELSDFIADGRTKYELNGIRFVVEAIFSDGIYVKIESKKYMNVFSRNSINAHMHHSHIEDIKLVTTCEQCGKDEVQDLGLCSDCISKLPTIDSRKVVDIHQNENGSFSVGSVVNMCEHDEIGQYVEAIEKEVPGLKDVRNKYDVQIVGKDGVKTTVDVYRVLNAFDVHDAATQHAIKKLLAAGKRGHKDYVQDLKEAIASIELAILEWEQTNV